MRGNQNLKRRFQVHKIFIRFQSWCQNNSLRHRHVQAWFFTLAYILLLAMVFFGPVLRVNKVACHTNRPPACPDFVVPELHKSIGQIIYTVPKPDIAQRIHKNTPLAKRIDIITLWPEILTANIVWQDPVAQVAIPASSSAYLVAETGHIIGANDVTDPSLPIIVAESAVDLVISDQLTDPSLTTALTFVNLLSNSRYTINSVYIQSALNMTAETATGYKIFLTSSKSAAEQVRALQLILSQSTINPATQVIDLRPVRPVIKPI